MTLRRQPALDLRLAPLGDQGLQITLGDELDLELAARVRRLERALTDEPFPGLVECVPCCGSLLLVFDPQLGSWSQAEQSVRSALDLQGPGEQPEAREHVLEAVYDGEDLSSLAEACGLSPAEVVERHSSRSYTVLMLGFLPGFPYLGLLDGALVRPRRATPRLRVPAGSLAVAGRQCGIYPGTSPGGWHLLGRVGERLFDPSRESPALFRPGDRVSFRSVARVQEIAPLSPGPVWESGSRPVAEVLSPGLLTTLQGAPIRGHRRQGVPGSGPLDPLAHAVANAAVGNDPRACALELTLDGPVLRFLATTFVALAGADLGPVLERADLGHWPVPPGRAVRVREGQLLCFHGARSGVRATLAFAGGLAPRLALGSRSTSRVGGFGGLSGRALAAGDVLHAFPTPSGAFQPSPSPVPLDQDVVMRIVPGPQAELFTREAWSCLLGDRYRLGSGADRVGARLEGPELTHPGTGEMLSDGLLPGAIQVPPDGQPIVSLADGPTTGGYPKIAAVVSSDLRALAQLAPGRGLVRFRLADGIQPSVRIHS